MINNENDGICNKASLDCKLLVSLNELPDQCKCLLK